MVEDLTPNNASGLADVTVEFQLDINGILNVIVTEHGTGKQVREQLKADRQRLSPEQIAASQAKLSAIYTASDDDMALVNMADLDDVDEIDFDPETLALLNRARTVLEQPHLNDTLAAQIRQCIDDITDATTDGDEEMVPDAF